MDSSNFLCPRCRTANSGTVPVAAKPCESSNASPPHNSISQASISHDPLCQSGLLGLLQARVPIYVSARSCKPAKPRPTPSANSFFTDRSCNSSPLLINTPHDHLHLNQLPNHETAFNIHTSQADHRDRGKRLRLPSCLLIETASNDAPAHPVAPCSRWFRCRLATFRPEPGKGGGGGEEGGGGGGGGRGGGEEGGGEGGGKGGGGGVALLSGSMSPMRGDVKEKFFSLPLRGETDVATSSSPISSEEALVA